MADLNTKFSAEELARLTPGARADLESRLLSRCSSRPIPKTNSNSSLRPLSFAQEGIWCASELAPNSPVYNLPQAFRLRGTIDRKALETALQELIDRQESLRTRFIIKDGAPFQFTQPTPFQLDFIDLRRMGNLKDRENKAHRLLLEEIRRPYQLGTDLMFRARLVQLDQETYLFIITLHHIVADFSSLEVLHRDLSALYHRHLDGRPASLPQLPTTFAEWAVARRNEGESTRFSTAAAFWQQHLSGILPNIEWSADQPRHRRQSFRGTHETFELSLDLASRLKLLSRKENVTLFILLSSALQTLLSRLTGQDDLLIGTPIDQRGAPGTADLIGLFLNTLLLRAEFSGAPTFRELMRRTRHRTVEAFAHQEMPFEMLVELLSRQRKSAQNHFCQVVFQYLPADWPAPVWEGVTVEVLPVDTGTAKFDLTLTILDRAGRLIGDLEYNCDLFDASMIQRWICHFRVLLEGIAADPDRPIGDLPLLLPQELNQLLVHWNATSTPYPRDASIQSVFEAQVKLAPEAKALVSGSEAYTYQDLNFKANQLAHFLKTFRVQPGDRVGVCVERSSLMVLSLLAILKAGAAYVPIDGTWPKERVACMLRDSGVDLVLTPSTSRHLRGLPVRLIFLDQIQADLDAQPRENLSITTGGDDLAYLIYTSGSTGHPKGVAIPHRGVVRLVKETNYAQFEGTFLQFAPLSFDASTFEIWGPLLNGATLVLYPSKFESLEQFAQVLRQYQITTVWLTAGLFHQLVDEHMAALKSLRQILAGGDVLSVPHILKILRNLPNCQLINGYGPTENTTFTCCHCFHSNWDGRSSAPIGRPISNTRVYILDDHMSPVPVGVVGELCTAGDGLALGYWNSPELTAARFVRDPFCSQPQGRLYRTGDQARYRSDGTIEFCGRLDDQVKINGFRIHLGEIERTLAELPVVKQSAVFATRASEGDLAKRLIAFVVPKEPAAISSDQVRGLLEQKLPEFMVPSQFVLLDALPLTANGKVDRRQLAALEQTTSAKASIPPENLTQQKVLEIWKEIFQQSQIGIDDNFFERGGHSLIATRVLSRINQTFGSNLSLAIIFEFPTVRRLAEKILNSNNAGSTRPIQPRARGERFNF